MEGNDMQKITPFLWFEGQAEEAMNYYLSIFKNSKALSINRFNGKVLTVVRARRSKIHGFEC
jgi:predicted 3-demethylubiquinone-9 3-methyltransferase (glyoxalase superfamily)